PPRATPRCQPRTSRRLQRNPCGSMTWRALLVGTVIDRWRYYLAPRTHPMLATHDQAHPRTRGLFRRPLDFIAGGGLAQSHCPTPGHPGLAGDLLDRFAAWVLPARQRLSSHPGIRRSAVRIARMVPLRCGAPDAAGIYARARFRAAWANQGPRATSAAAGDHALVPGASPDKWQRYGRASVR